MSHNQSRAEKSETVQYRRTGRSSSYGQQKGSAGHAGWVKGGSGPGVASCPPPINPSASSLSSNRSSKKPNNNAQGVQGKVGGSGLISESSNASAPTHSTRDGALAQPPLPVAATAPAASASARPDGSSVQKDSRPDSKNPSSDANAPLASPDKKASATPAKGDGPRGLHFQFGSFSPSMMQIPARTSSAPPNLDEQKLDQARREAYRTAPSTLPSVPKQHSQRKDAVPADQPRSGEVQPITNPKKEAQPITNPKKEAQVSSIPTANLTSMPPVHSVSRLSMQMSFVPPQASVLFGGPNTQVQPSGITAPAPIALPIASAPQIQKQMFPAGLPQHSMSAQAIVPQGQSMGFTSQIVPQLSPPGGSTGSSQYPQLGGARKPVKIIDPKTHKELRFDKQVEANLDSGPSGLRSHPSSSQSLPISTFPSPALPINYYPTSFSLNPSYPTSSIPLMSSHISNSSQPPKFNYTVCQASQTLPHVNSSTIGSLHSNKSLSPVLSFSESLSTAPAVVHSIPSQTKQVSIKPAPAFVGEKVGSITLPAVGKDDSCKVLKPNAEDGFGNLQRDTENSQNYQQQLKPGHEHLAPKSLSAGSKQAVPVSVSVETNASKIISSAPSAVPMEPPLAVTSDEHIQKESVSRSNSVMIHQNKTAKKGHGQAAHQVSGQSTPLPSLPSTTLGCEIPANGVFESADAKTSPSLLGASKVISEPSDLLITHAETRINGAGIDYKLSLVSNSGNSVETVTAEQNNIKLLEGSLDGERHSFDPASPKPFDPASPKPFDPASPMPLDSSKQIVEHSSDPASPMPLDSSKQIVEHSSDPASPMPLDTSQQIEESVLNTTLNSNVVGSIENVGGEAKKPSGFDKDVPLNTNLVASTASATLSIDSEVQSSSIVSLPNSEADGSSSLDASLSRSNDTPTTAVAIVKSGVEDSDLDTVLRPSSSDDTLRHVVGSAENFSCGQASFLLSGSKDKSVPELNRSKSMTAKAKKKRREILQKADAAGTTSDLYMAYKGPDGKKETDLSLDSLEASVNHKQLSTDVAQEDVASTEHGEQNKIEPDDWEDAADISTPKLEDSNCREQVHCGINHDEDGHGIMARKYSRDFLLKFSELCIFLPDNSLFKPDLKGLLVANAINPSHLSDHELLSNGGRIVDRSSGGARLERRGSGMVDDDKWNKWPGPPTSGRDPRLEIRPGQGGAHGVLRNSRTQLPSQHVRGILSGPTRSSGPQGGSQRFNSDADRWQQGSGFQRGLIPPPQTMHKAERKYEVGKVTDEEQAKQRQLKAILNKLTPQNFEKLFEQVKAVNIDKADTLNGTISQIFDKALMEPTFCEMYANFCSRLSVDLPDFTEGDEKITFKRVLLNKCQEEFERGEREQAEADRIEEEGEIKQTEEEREEKRLKARRRMLGNIRLIGELYKKKMLTERIMHECIKKLLGQCQIPEEEDIEALCKLMSTIGEMIDHSKAKEHMDAYFGRMTDLSNNMKLSSRVRFMLKDSIDMRKNKWQQRRKIEGPKKIEEVHRDAVQERQAQTSRLGRNSSNPLPRKPMDFGSRGSHIAPSATANTQVGGYRGLPRGLPTHDRGFGGAQDVRLDDKLPYEGRTLSSFPQRPILGPQGGLGKEMSIRGQLSIPSNLVADAPPSSSESRRVTPSLNGHSSISDTRSGYGTKEDTVSKHMPERIAQEKVWPDKRNPDHSLDRSVPSSQPAQPSEDRMRGMSIAAIREYYSAKDEKEVRLCVKDLNSPGFHPTMISLWVTDSFERKEVERDLLGELLVHLAKSGDGMLSQGQLVKGFEEVLMMLEDAVNDAPRAAEYLGHIFGKAVAEEVISLEEVGRLIYEGGEEPGNLREGGLAAELLGTVLEMIRLERGDSVFDEMRVRSRLRLEDFSHPDPNRSRKLLMFI